MKKLPCIHPKIARLGVHCASRPACKCGSSAGYHMHVKIKRGSRLHETQAQSESGRCRNAGNSGTVEVLAMAGTFGAMLSGAQALILEHKDLLTLQWSAQV